MEPPLLMPCAAWNYNIFLNFVQKYKHLQFRIFEKYKHLQFCISKKNMSYHSAIEKKCRNFSTFDKDLRYKLFSFQILT